MTDKAVDLDKHRGMAAQKATDLRRLLAEVVANERALRSTQDELEAQLIAAPASTWEEDAAATSWMSSKNTVVQQEVHMGRFTLLLAG